MGWGDWGDWGNSPPVADAGDDQTCTVWEQIILDGSGSHDPGGNIVSWLWYIEQEEPIEGELITHRFDFTQENEVLLKVTDNYGATALDTCIITVTPLELQIKICDRPSPTMKIYET